MRSRELITSQDVFSEILLRLPARSLLRFKLTCKNWNAIISDAKFAELHSKTWIQRLRLVYQTICSWSDADSFPLDLCICKPKENKILMEKLHHEAFKRVDSYQSLKDSSGALVLFNLKDRMVSTCMVCDCTNNNQIVLPSLTIDDDFTTIERLVYDASTNMHKVLVYTYTNDYGHVLQTDVCHITSFSMKTLTGENGWRRIPAPSTKLNFSKTSITIRGIQYWVVSVYEPCRTIFIQPFDIVKEQFLNTIMFPDEVPKYNISNEFYLLEFRGSLGFILPTCFKIEMWVLKDSNRGSWIQLHKIHLRSMYDCSVPYNFPSGPLFILESLERLPSIFFKHKDNYFMYNMKGKKLKEMEAGILPTCDCCLAAAWFS